jgi:dienelactone hydrolase/predicted Ser/Thr protein kinase
MTTPRPGFATGSLLAGKYQIQDEAGHGGMGIVYRAEDIKLKRPVALKFLPPEWTQDKEARERFLQEARAAAALSHPHICTIYEVDESGEQLFIAMEYIEGEVLRERSRRGPLPLEDALNLTAQAAEGLEAAHQKGIVHRDIKSANIMVTDKGQAKIMDFGLAKLRGGSSLTREGATIGTVAYMSPEQARGEKVDHRTDIWSLGVVFYEMLTGELPFRGERDVSLLYSIVHEEPQSLKERKPPVPPELQRVIERALSKNPASRYQTAADMRKDIGGYQDALRSERAGVFNIRSFLKRVRRPAVAIPFALGVIAIAALAFWFFNRQAKIRWAKNELLPRITQLAGVANFLDYIKIYQLAVEAEKLIPSDPQLSEILKNYSTRLSIITEPPGAKISIKGYHEPEKEWAYLGVSPIDNLRMPYEILRFKMEKEGYEPVWGASTSWDYDAKNNTNIPGKILRKLDKSGGIPPGMVRITGGEVEKIGMLNDFFMDLFEVTNRQYKEFIEKGGYQKKEYWKKIIIKDRRELSWEQAMAEFVDSTGRPGPATWQGGDYPEGQDDYPVSGISWHEATAYAESVGKSLPTCYHWGIARGELTHLIDNKVFSEFSTPQSNFKGKGTERVGSNPAITAYGLYDMGGNVREWCSNETPLGRLIRGGAWNDIPYMAGDWSQASLLDRSAKNGFRCILYVQPERIPASAFASAKIQEFPDFYKQKPVPNSVFRVYREQFSYDKSDLNARVEWRNETSKDWIQEKISFDAAYENERVFAYLFLPKNSSPPFQTAIYVPGSGSFYQRSSAEMEKSEFRNYSWIVTNGRAFLFPVYKGTFERGSEALAKLCDGDTSHEFSEFFIKLVKDFKRSVDYLETRPDIDSNKLAYLGLSWGGQYGALIPAIEGRLKASVLDRGGLYGNTRPEVNEFNYVTRVKIPTLMLNGRYDMTFPYELSVKPMFEFLGTPPGQKELKLYNTDHFIPRAETIKETLRWLDKYLGPVK